MKIFAPNIVTLNADIAFIPSVSGSEFSGSYRGNGSQLTNIVTSSFAVSASWAASSGVSDHGALTGLFDDDHSQYALLSGRTSGQSLKGGTGVTDTLSLIGTSGNGTVTNAAIIFKVGNNGATTAATILNNGKIGIGSTPDASSLLDITTTSLGLGLPSMTSTQRDAITSPRNGLVVYNSTDHAPSLRANGAWVNMPTPIKSINSQTGTSYTLVIGDIDKLITLSNTSAITLTIPPESSVNFPVGTVIDICQLNTGQVTVSPGSGVTINSADSRNKLRVRYSSGSIVKSGTNTWILIGDITV